MSYKFNPFSGKLDYFEEGIIPELTSEPTTPPAQSTWVLATGSGAIADGTPIGLLLALTYTGNSGSAFTYQLSYRTAEGTTIRTPLT